MSEVKVKMPKMGEGVAEATLISWLVKAGDHVEAEDALLEIATDKVDSEITAPCSGTVTQTFFEKDDVIKVGEVVAVMESDEEYVPEDEISISFDEFGDQVDLSGLEGEDLTGKELDMSAATRFYSPLVKSIARVEGIPMSELEKIKGTGLDARVTKDDMIAYLQTRRKTAMTGAGRFQPQGDQVLDMGRMRRIIAERMSSSLQTSAHVNSILDADITSLSLWRDKVKKDFEKKHGEKLTFTPLFLYAVARSLRDYPMVNVSVDGQQIIRHKDIHIGLAVALPSGDLIVPVIKFADMLTLAELAAAVNDMAYRARNGKLKPDEVQGSTYTVTNVGGFGTLIGTPIINQPETAILALGTAQKVPAVIETPEGDVIAIRRKMFMTHAYDHRVIDGALGGEFVRRVKEYMENWDKDFEY